MKSGTKSFWTQKSPNIIQEKVIEIPKVNTTIKIKKKKSDKATIKCPNCP